MYLVVHEGLQTAHTLVLYPAQNSILALVASRGARAKDVQQHIKTIVLTKLLYPAGIGRREGGEGERRGEVGREERERRGERRGRLYKFQVRKRF